jgi:hypothetical protein
MHLCANVNSQAAEEYNSWMNSHTLPAAEMTQAHYAVYWWALFHEHNQWILKQASAARRRYARGHMAHNPDLPRSSGHGATSRK